MERREIVPRGKENLSPVGIRKLIDEDRLDYLLVGERGVEIIEYPNGCREIRTRGKGWYIEPRRKRYGI